MKTYIVFVSETEAKLVTNLPDEPEAYNYTLEQDFYRACDDYKLEVNQAINSSPFIKNLEVIEAILYKNGGYSTTDLIYSKQPYLVDLSGYVVSEPEEVNVERLPCSDSERAYGHKFYNIVEYVTISPKQDSSTQ